MKSSVNYFIWTEAFNCGEILTPMLSSYLKHHNYPIHVFATDNDLQEVDIKSDLVVKNSYPNKPMQTKLEKKVLNGYRKGHLGTAILWEHIVNTRKEKIFIHLDADTIFLGDVVTELIKAIEIDDYSIAGSRRAYKNRGYRKGGKDGLKLDQRPDAVNTDCFAFTKQFIALHPRFLLRRKILGRRTSLKPVVDFFDPVTFEIISKGGKILYVDSPSSGSQSFIDYTSKFMTSRISFAAVGSGCNFYKNGSEGIPEGYSGYALASYSLFSKYLLDKEIEHEPLQSDELVQKLTKLDKVSWTIS